MINIVWMVLMDTVIFGSIEIMVHGDSGVLHVIWVRTPKFVLLIWVLLGFAIM